MNILVTGGAGYIGSKLVHQLLRDGYHVDVVDNLRYGYEPVVAYLDHPNLTFVNMDVALKSNQKLFKLQSYDVIIPLAALVGMPLCDKYPERAKDINVGQIEWIVDTLNDLALEPLIIYPNTNSGYGSTSGTEPCTEETPMNPISVYGKTKCDAENYIADNYNNYCIFRLATVFGCSPRPRLDLLVNDLAFKIYHDTQISLYEGGFMRNFVHIDDVVKGFMWAIQNYEFHGDVRISDYGLPENESAVYNLGNDNANMSKLDLAQTICRVYKKDFYKLIKSDITTKDPDQRNYIVSSKKLNKAGFEATESILEGLRDLRSLFELLPKNSQTLNRYNNNIC